MERWTRRAALILGSLIATVPAFAADPAAPDSPPDLLQKSDRLLHQISADADAPDADPARLRKRLDKLEAENAANPDEKVAKRLERAEAKLAGLEAGKISPPPSRQAPTAPQADGGVPSASAAPARGSTALGAVTQAAAPGGGGKIFDGENDRDAPAMGAPTASPASNLGGYLSLPEGEPREAFLRSAAVDLLAQVETPGSVGGRSDYLAENLRADSLAQRLDSFLSAHPDRSNFVALSARGNPDGTLHLLYTLRDGSSVDQKLGNLADWTKPQNALASNKSHDGDEFDGERKGRSPRRHSKDEDSAKDSDASPSDLKRSGHRGGAGGERGIGAGIDAGGLEAGGEFDGGHARAGRAKLPRVGGDMFNEGEPGAMGPVVGKNAPRGRQGDQARGALAANAAGGAVSGGKVPGNTPTRPGSAIPGSGAPVGSGSAAGGAGRTKREGYASLPNGMTSQGGSNLAPETAGAPRGARPGGPRSRGKSPEAPAVESAPSPLAAARAASPAQTQQDFPRAPSTVSDELRDAVARRAANPLVARPLQFAAASNPFLAFSSWSAAAGLVSYAMALLVFFRRRRAGPVSRTAGWS